MFPSIEPLGDSAALIAWRSLSTEAAWLAVQNAAEHLNRHNMDGIVAIAPAFRSLTVYYNCGILDWNRVLLWISETLLSVDQTVTILNEDSKFRFVTTMSLHSISTQLLRLMT
jgi:allophanate hydrolase subunit 1